MIPDNTHNARGIYPIRDSELTDIPSLMIITHSCALAGSGMVKSLGAIHLDQNKNLLYT